MRKTIARIAAFSLMVLLFQQCAQKEGAQGGEAQDAPTSTSTPFSPYAIDDSSAIVTYSSGLKIYTVRQGPGDFPREGMNIRMNYHGLLDNGEVFDSTYPREQPFDFRLGRTEVISGLEEAVEKLRFGSRAVVIIPPSLAYSNREERPANIPENSTLIFHIDLLGSF